MLRAFVAVTLSLSMLITGCGLNLPEFSLPTTAATANPTHQIDVSFTQVGKSLSVRLHNPNLDVGLIRSPFELALIDTSGLVIATAGQGGIPGTAVNTIYHLPPGGEYGLDRISVPNGITVASVELTVLGQWFKWDTVDPPTVTVTDATVLADTGYFGPSVTGRLTLERDGPRNVRVIAFVRTSAGTIASDVTVECAQTGQTRSFEIISIADARGPYSLDSIVAYPTSVTGAGPQVDLDCVSAPASALPTDSSLPTATSTIESPTSSPIPSPTTVTPTVASTSDVSAPRTDQIAHLATVRLGPRDGYDRLVLEFTDLVPGYTIGYRPLPMQEDASGAEIPLPGATTAVRITLTSAVADWDFTNYDYQGPSTVTGDTREVTEARMAGDFEAVLTWVVGLRTETPFRVMVLDSPPRLVIDFQH